MIRLLVVLLGTLWSMGAQAAPIVVRDDLGQVLRLPHAPRRIIALTPHLTELLYAAGAGEQLVGADSASDYPPAARALPRVGDFSRVNFERLLALKPDLVVVWAGGNPAAELHRLATLGIPLLHTRATQLSDVARLLRLLGRASGHDAAGEAAAQRFEAALTARATAPARLPVFYQIWDRPLMTVGGAHWISDALARCGARNIFAELRGLSPVVSREAVLLRAPAVIVSGTDAPSVAATWRKFPALPAVRNQAFVQVNADLLHRPTPRILEGIDSLCRALAPYAR